MKKRKGTLPCLNHILLDQIPDDAEPRQSRQARDERTSLVRRKRLKIKVAFLSFLHAAVACGGLCATARDWGRFGLCLAHDGKNLQGEQIFPRDYVVGSRSSEAQKFGTSYDGWTSAYHNKLWVYGQAQEICSMIGAENAFFELQFYTSQFYTIILPRQARDKRRKS
jgi:hypothetical protein